jgi:hypothetical protein
LDQQPVLFNVSWRPMTAQQTPWFQGFLALQEVARRPRMTLVVEAIPDVWVDEWPRKMPAIELALLRRGVEHRDSVQERCSRCGRTPLVGERVYEIDEGLVLCGLCQVNHGEAGLNSRVLRGPGLSRAIRVLAGRAA